MGEAAEEAAVRILGAGSEWADGSELRVLSTLRKASDVSSSSDELAERIIDWPTRYHFSRLRSKVLSPLRIGSGTRVLDLGGGTGPLSRRLGELGADVLLVDGSEARARAAAERCRDLPNVSVAVGTVFDLDATEPFDVVLVVGVLEYADDAEATLRAAARLLAPDGAVAVAIENAIGLKYLLGYAEDHVGLPWVGWEGYLGIEHVRTYSRRELRSLLEAAGLPEQAWFYPFPDYKLPTTIVSEAGYADGGPEVVDAVVPKPTTPESSLPVLLCDSRAAHRTMLRAGLGPDVANSFLVIASATGGGVDAHADRETLAWLIGSERRSRFMRDRRVARDGDRLAIVDDSSPAGRIESGWVVQRRYPALPFESGELLDVLMTESIVAADAERTRTLLALWTEALKEGIVDAASGEANPFAPEAGALGLAGDFLDSQPANFVHRDGRLHRLDVEWEIHGAIDFELTCIRGLFHFAVDIFTRGIVGRRVAGSDVGSFVLSLGEAAGVAGRAQALERLPAAEGELQAIIRGWPPERGRTEIERIVAAAPEELAVEAGISWAPVTRREREAELDRLRRAHEAQARHLISERLEIAAEIEREIGQLREEIVWRKGVMEHQEEAIEHHRRVIEEIQNSRSIRYTAPLRRLAALFRR